MPSDDLLAALVPSIAPLTFEIPDLALRGSNAREHHMARARRVKRERAAVGWAFAAAIRRAPLPPAPWVVTLTRVAPGPGLDAHDNLPVACKGAVDELALQLGLPDDRDARVRWRYEQARGPWGVRIAIVGAP